MANWTNFSSVTNPLRALTRRQFILSLCVLFVLLVAFGVHGSSTGITAGWWMPEKPYTGYLFNAASPAPAANSTHEESLLMNHARVIRWDELVIFTPFALSQLAQKPAFPVVNHSIGNGQNMLAVPHTPVWHIVSLARPATWGFFLFGAQRGIAWFWWFQVIGCFIVLFLLFEIVLQGHRLLAAFGAFWFMASAYIICWSQWAAHVTFFGVLGCLATYHLCKAETKRMQFICALLLGLSIPGFVMIMYPPWQVALGFFVPFIFIVLAIRDKLYLSFKTQLGARLVFLSLAVFIAASLTLLWLRACLPDLKIMADTVYPGRRVSTGGDYSFGLFFKGLYNLLTIYEAPQALRNESEAASFYYLFPAVLFALPFSKRLVRRLGIVGWSLIAYIIGMTLFVLVGIPAWLAKLTLLSYIPSYRADLTIGLASILLCVYVLTIYQREEEPVTNQWEKFMPWIAASAVACLFILHGISLSKETGGLPSPLMALGVSLVMGAAGYLLLAGKSRAFCGLMGAVVVATTALFNPLATNLDHIYKSELAQAITAINNQSSERPFWVCYGGVHTGVLVTILGGKSLTGIQWPPQLDIWRALNPERSYEQNYNRYGEVILDYTPDDSRVAFRNPLEGLINVMVSPTNPTLKALGARYVLLMGEAQTRVDTSKLQLLYRSAFGSFMIFEIP